MTEEKPTHASLTSNPCTCKFLERASEDPDVPIVFDADMNEFHIENVGKNRGHTMVYHCPFCGGAAPKSKRAAFFASVTHDEVARLHELTRGLAAVADVIKKFGKPDHDMAEGLTITTPASETNPPTTKGYRVLRYGGLSKTADVHFTDYGPDGGLRRTIQGKYLGSPKRRPSPSSRSKAPTRRRR